MTTPAAIPTAITPETSLKTRLKNGALLTGLFVAEFRSAHYAPLLDAAGYDFAIFDLEHGAFTNRDLAEMIPGFAHFRCKPIVRVPAVRREFFQPVLDLGAAGIVVPMVENPEDVRAAAAMMKYLPQGRRGMSYGCPHVFFQSRDRDAYTRMANDNLILVAQIETARGLDNLDAILAEPGIDVAFVGNTDLALSLGIPNDLEKGPVHDAIRRVLQTARARGIAGGGNYLDPRHASLFHADGLRFITTDNEIERFAAGLRLGRDTLLAGLPGAAFPNRENQPPNQASHE